MIQISIKPALYKFKTCKEFADQFQIGIDDLIITNEYIFRPYFDEMYLSAQLIFQELYGTGEPTDLMVEAIIKEANKKSFKRVIAIGGGSVIDIAKVIAIAAADSSVDELYDRMPDLTKRCELVIVPTTCGTGSEVTSIAIVNRTRLGTKMGLTGPAMYADAAVLIPGLLSGLPFHVFATSSIDALVHATESALSPQATPYTKLFSYKAIDMIIAGYKKIARDGKTLSIDLLEDFLLASNFAGCAFNTAGCAAVHATSYPLGGKYHIPHGEVNYAMFTGVLKNYMDLKQDGEIAVLNQHLAVWMGCDTALVYDCLEELLDHILPKKPLHAYGMTQEDVPVFAASVMNEQTRLMNHNFVPLDEERIRKIYRELL